MLNLLLIFRAKLGWLTGNIYSRVATEDWVPTIDKDNEAFRNRIRGILDENSLWAKEEAIDIFKKKAQAISARTGKFKPTYDEIKQLIEECESEIESALDTNISILAEQIGNTIQIADEHKRGLLNKLKNNPSIRALVSKKVFR